MKKSKNKVTNWLGVAGALIALIAMYLPCLSVSAFGYTESATYAELLKEGEVAPIIMVIGLLVIGVLYFYHKNIISLVLTIIYTALFVYVIDYYNSRYSFDKGLGFWLTAIAIIVMIASPFLKNINNTINAKIFPKAKAAAPVAPAAPQDNDSDEK